ncbi:unnamed protein product [Durusdinium trenchii]|uniref:Ribonucleoside-diphosphate reductase n=1 Tax=Durusdinium trenchii TaxID=1381693 RepID=A0ABP0M0R2_9DINO
MKRSVSRGASGFHLFWYSRRPKRKQRPSAQEVKFDNITKRIRTLCGGLDPRFIDPVPVTQKVVEGFYNGIKTAEVDTLAAETCAYMSQKHPDFSTLAARIAVSNLHKNTSDSFAETCRILFHFVDAQGREAGLLSQEVFDFVQKNAGELDEALDYDRDLGYDYFGFKTLEKSYLLRVHGKIVERPQHMIMRTACEIHCGDLASALQSYDLMSRKFFTHATPTLFNAGTPKPQMSSCFLLKMKSDSIDGIYDTLKQCAVISKSAGGIGVAVSNIRASGSYIRGTNGQSNGLVPMLKNFNETARYVDQAACHPPQPASVHSVVAPVDGSVVERETRSASPAMATPSDAELPTVALITGASRGYGRALAEALCAARGAPLRLALLARDGPGVEETARRCCEGRGGRVQSKQFLGDLGRSNEMVQWMEPVLDYLAHAIETVSCTEPGAKCELLILHNAGSLGRLAYSHERPALEASIGALDLNVTGFVVLSQMLLQRFAPQVRRPENALRIVVVNISSLLALQVMPSWSLYATGKAARDMYMRTLAADAHAAQLEVRTLSWAPGPMETEMMQEILRTCPDPEVLKQFQEMQHKDRLVSLSASAEKLMKLLKEDSFQDGEPCSRPSACERQRRVDPAVAVHDPRRATEPAEKTSLRGIQPVDPQGTLRVGGGKRKGALAVYLEPWHADVFEFLELKKNHGKEEQRARDLFYGLWVPDLFMKRVKADEEWTLFCPNEAFDEKSGKTLMDLWGEDFEELYCRLEAQGKGRKTVKALQLWFRILEAQMETGTPYMLYKDHANRKSNQQNLGTIHCSNLCTEIIEYTSQDEVAVCNLASIALPSFVAEEGYDFQKLYEVTKVVTRNLNKVIDRNYYPVEQAQRSNMRHRPIGLGVQGLADAFMMMTLGWTLINQQRGAKKLPFESEEAKRLNEDIFETIYFGACEASCELAEVNGTYETYEGCPVSQGQLQFDMWGVTPKSGRWDWTELKQRIAQSGLRNSLLVAPMPTASTAQILGNNESFEPYTQNLYVRRVLSGEFVQVNRHLLKDLIAHGLWNEELRTQLIAQNGSVQKLDLPAEMKELYKTVWEIKQKVVVDMAADRGAYIDQSQSLNIHMIDATTSKLSSMHFHGWHRGLKTGMYYLRTKAAADAIKFTVDVKKLKPEEESIKAPRCNDERGTEGRSSEVFLCRMQQGSLRPRELREVMLTHSHLVPKAELAATSSLPFAATSELLLESERRQMRRKGVERQGVESGSSSEARQQVEEEERTTDGLVDPLQDHDFWPDSDEVDPYALKVAIERVNHLLDLLQDDESYAPGREEELVDGCGAMATNELKRDDPGITSTCDDQSSTGSGNRWAFRHEAWPTMLKSLKESPEPLQTSAMSTPVPSVRSVRVSLLSGRTVELDAEDQLVLQLLRRAEAAFGRPLECLLDRGRPLEPHARLTEPCHENVECLELTAVAKGAQLVGHRRALGFAYLRPDGELVGWGCGPRRRVSGVRQVAVSECSFAAIRVDGSLTTWGCPHFGGDCRNVQEHLRGLVQIQSSCCAFAALQEDGSVLGWGHPSLPWSARPEDVVAIQASSHAFAALLKNGRVMTWGNKDYGGDCSGVEDQLVDVNAIQASAGAFAALCGPEKRVVTWGSADYGGECGEELKNIHCLQSSARAFAALEAGGGVRCWGDPHCGGVVPKDVQEQLIDVIALQAAPRAFCALRRNGTVITWGDAAGGAGDSPVLPSPVVAVQATARAFAALLRDGRVSSWGHKDCGGDCSSVAHELFRVREIQASTGAFAALRQDGRVVTWGSKEFGGDSSAVQQMLLDVQVVQASRSGFAALREDGNVVIWGPDCARAAKWFRAWQGDGAHFLNHQTLCLSDSER